MTRRGVTTRTLLTVALVGLIVAAVMAGWNVVSSKIEQRRDAPVDYGDVSGAVTAAVPRVVAVEDLGRTQNGFGHRFSLSLVTDSAESFSTDELDAVVEAIWQTLPWEPNTIKLTAGIDTPGGHEVVDLREAADELEFLGVTHAGAGGVSLTGMAERYGERSAPD